MQHIHQKVVKIMDIRHATKIALGSITILTSESLKRSEKEKRVSALHLGLSFHPLTTIIFFTIILSGAAACLRENRRVTGQLTTDTEIGKSSF